MSVIHGAPAHHGRRVLLALALLQGAGGLTGCYRYSPPSVAPAAGTRVRVELTDRGTAELAPLVGMGIAAIEGRLVSANDSVLTVAVALVERHDGMQTDWSGERLAVPRGAAAAVRGRTLSAPRSALLAGAIVTGAMLAARGLSGTLGGGSPGGVGHPGPR